MYLLLAAVAWYLVGLVTMAWALYDDDSNIVLGDILLMLIVALEGPLVIVGFLVADSRLGRRVVIRRRLRSED